jgi:CubicO group peptidase (beta-lactamase class C family)
MNAMERLSRELLARHANVRALLVVRGGSLAWEEYRHACGPEQRHHIFSVTKSFVSALIGMAIADGAIGSSDDRVDLWLGECVEAGTEPPRLRDLMTMTADGFCPGAPKPGIEQRSAPAGTRWGETFSYTDHQGNLVARCLHRAIGGRSADFARDRLLRPLGILEHDWYQDETGGILGGYGLHLTARDLTRFGQLYLDEGMHGGQRLIPADWVRVSTTPHAPGGPPVRLPYGFMWWSAEAGGARVSIAAGLGGQRIYVAPSRRMVIVITAKDVGATPDDTVLPWLAGL